MSLLEKQAESGVVYMEGFENKLTVYMQCDNNNKKQSNPRWLCCLHTLQRPLVEVQMGSEILVYAD